MLIRILFSVFLLGLLIFFTVHSVDLLKVRELLWTFPKDKLFILFGVSLSISILKAWRFLLLLRNNDIKVTFLENLRAFITSQAATPLPGGESVRGILISHETGKSILKTTAPVITQAYFEILTASILTLIGSLIYKVFRLPSFLLLILLIFLAIILINKRLSSLIFEKLEFWNWTKKIAGKFQIAQNGIKDNFYDDKTHLPAKVLTASLILSLGADLLGGFLLFLIASYSQVSLSFLHSVFIYAASLVIQGIAIISPGGIGFTEGGMLGLLALSNVNLNNALSIIIIFRLVTLVFYIVLGIILFTIFYAKSFIFQNGSLNMGSHLR
jgi:glycosyltransferase 2 family protein